jgi:hypothetical protein
MWDFFKPVLDAGSKIFDFIDKNPETSKILAGAIGGAATGAAAYYGNKQQSKNDMKMLQARLDQEAKFKERRASSGDSGYGDHAKNLVGGTGLLAPYVKPKGY